MTTLTANQWVILFVGLISLIPSIVLFNHYLKIRIADFLIFSGVFLSVTFAALSQIFVDITGRLIFMQIHMWSLSWTFLLFFLHSSRILWTRPPTGILIVGIGWFCILTVFILAFEIMPQGDSATVWFTEMPVVPSSYHPKGAGIALANGVILFSTSHSFILYLYCVYATGILLYSYVTIEPPFHSEKMVRTKKLWIIIWSLICLFGILHVPWIFSLVNLESTTVINILALLGEAISAIIAIFMPESMLISQAQLLRAQNLYETVQQMESREERAQFGMESLVTYLQSIPVDLWAQIQPD